MHADEKKEEEEMRIEIRLAYADPGRNDSNATVSFHVRTHLPRTYIRLRITSVLPSSWSPLLSSALLS
jgi:hypothetical protein